MRKGPILQLVVLRSFILSLLLLFRRTEAGFETGKALRIIIIIFFLSKRKPFFPHLYKSCPCPFCCSGVSCCCVHWSAWPSQSPWSVCPLSHTALPQASHTCAHVIGSESLWRKHFPFQGGLWVSACERASVMTMYTVERSWWIPFSTAPGQNEHAGGGKQIFPPDQKSIASEINFCGFGGWKPRGF